MKTEAFRTWLNNRIARNAAASRLSEARRVKAIYGDLDEHFARNGCSVLVKALSYSASDAAAGLENPTSIEIEGDVRNGLASLKSAIQCYVHFCRSHIPDSNARPFAETVA